MHTVYFESQMDDDARRRRLYEGQLFAFSARPESQALRRLAQRMIEEAFEGIDPLMAQFHMPVEEFVSIVAPLKPRFIHAADTKDLLRSLLASMGCDMEKTYFDVPRLRVVTHGGYLTSGVGYAHHPHRDTWYSAPMCQLNWWLPIYEMESESSMAFHPAYWDRAVLNDSERFNYYDWNSVARATAAQHIKADARWQPKPQEPIELDPQVRIVTEAGGILLFSAAHLHSTVPNTSGRIRYSIDFRTVHFEDVVSQAGAPNVDSRPTGTSLRDFMRCSDLARMPADLVETLDSGDATKGVLVYTPAGAGQ